MAPPPQNNANTPNRNQPQSQGAQQRLPNSRQVFGKIFILKPSIAIIIFIYSSKLHYNNYNEKKYILSNLSNDRTTVNDTCKKLSNINLLNQAEIFIIFVQDNLNSKY